MESYTPNHYEQCEECEYAEFMDFNNMKCLKSVEYSATKQCHEFKKIVEESDTNIITSGDFNELVEEIEEIKEEKEHEAINKIFADNIPKNKIVDIEAEKKSGDDDKEYDYRLNTLQDVDVYDSTEVNFRRKIRTEPGNKLIPFHREVIRNGMNLIMLKESNGKKVYLVKDPKKLSICEQCKVKEKPVDILLMSHDDFDKFVDSTKPEVREIKDKYDEQVESILEQKYGKTHAIIKDTFKKDSKFISRVNIISFNSQFIDLKIGRLAPQTKFYITHSEGDKKARKIKTYDGQEGILLSNPETYKVILPALQEFVNIIVILVTLAIIIGTILLILEETGYIIIIGIVVIPIAYLVAIVIGAPVYLLLSQIIKRL